MNFSSLNCRMPVKEQRERRWLATSAYRLLSEPKWKGFEIENSEDQASSVLGHIKNTGGKSRGCSLTAIEATEQKEASGRKQCIIITKRQASAWIPRTSPTGPQDSHGCSATS